MAVPLAVEVRVRTLIVRAAPTPDSPAVGVHIQIGKRVVHVPGRPTHTHCPCGQPRRDSRTVLCAACVADVLPDRWGRG